MSAINVSEYGVRY